MKTKRLLSLVFGLLLAFHASPLSPVLADDTPPRPYYIVQPGDTLSSIAYRFGIDIHDLAAANNITHLSDLQAGQKLELPGLEGFQGEMTVRAAAFGDNLTAFSRAYHIPRDNLARLNHVVTPYQIFAGKGVILPKDALQHPQPQRVLVKNASLTDTALAHGSSPWALALANQLPGTWAALPGDVLMLPGTVDKSDTPLGLPSGVSVALEPQQWPQGRTGEVKVTADAIQAVEGGFGERPLHFFPFENQTWVALQGVFALAEPGLRPLRLQITLDEQGTFAFEQAIEVIRGNYTSERLNVPANLLDPALNEAETQKFSELTREATPTRYWQGVFRPPEAPPLDDCHPSYFGTRRNYNDSFFWYHTGLDFCGRVGTPIYAPADGMVIFTGVTEIHGNVTIIDHGWGVYTTYCHQSEILVKEGQRVHTGDLIGKVGRTGRVTGPHLHWEVWVGNVPVDPLEWLQRAFP